jgi:hypothetical protein
MLILKTLKIFPPEARRFFFDHEKHETEKIRKGVCEVRADPFTVEIIRRE